LGGKVFGVTIEIVGAHRLQRPIENRVTQIK
jgi:hypothetical protein